MIWHSGTLRPVGKGKRNLFGLFTWFRRPLGPDKEAKEHESVTSLVTELAFKMVLITLTIGAGEQRLWLNLYTMKRDFLM